MRERFKTMIPVSVVDGQMSTVGINVPRPMTEVEWAQLHKVLRKMKPALVEPPAALPGTDKEN